MAEGPVDVTLKTLEEEITCPVCHQHFEDPRVLPCSHYYCRDCVQFLATQAGFHRPFSCPECRSPTRLPQRDASRLPKALAVIRMKHLHSDHLKRQPAPRKMCSKHSDPVKLFCLQCKCLICGMCVAFDHKTHTYKLVSEITPKFRDQVRKEMAPLNAAHKRYTDTTERAKEKITDVQTQNTEIIEAVNQWVKEWMEIIQQCSRNIIRYSSDISQKKVGNLLAQIKHLESDSASVQSLLKYCEQNLENATDEEFIELHKQMLSQIEKECRKHIGANLKLADDADLEVKLPSNQSLKEVCRNEVNVLVGADHACCTVDLKNAEVKKSLCCTVHYTRSQNGALWKKPQAVEGKMKSLVDGSLTRLKGTQKKEGVYEMMYTPQIRGRHQLAVTVNGKQVAGNPFTTCAKIPPTQLGTLVRAISGLDRPYSVAFNSIGEVLVTLKKEIRVLDSHGKVLRTIKQGFQDLAGIAVDKEDNIFISDKGPHCVYKLDKDGNQLKIIGKCGNGNSEFNDARSLAVIGENVFVCDSNNHRIQVFTRELDFVKIIGSHGKGIGQFDFVFDISQDEAGNLYVCDCGNHRIQVLRNDGEFLHSFGTEGKSRGQLDQPTSVCYSDMFVYVSELGNHGVSVFDRNGQYITSFGSVGLTSSYFSRPFILRVDQDGFVYVCDYGNNRVLIF